MRRAVFLVLLLVCLGGHVRGQGLSWEASPTPLALPDHPGFLSVTLVPATSPKRTTTLPAAPTFDFSAAKPHLAFFCRLEINESAGSVIPVKFRLGGHRYWQDDLLRRR